MASNDPPSDARGAALDALTGCLRRHQALDEALRLDAIRDARDRAFARLLTATVLRRKGQLDDLLARCLDRSPPPLIHDLLRLGAAQLLFLDLKPHAAVDSSVELAKSLGFAPLAALVNAVLRRIATQGPGWVASQDPATLNMPAWLWQALMAAYGEPTLRAIAKAHLSEAPLDLTPAGNGELWAGRLEAEILFTGSLRRAIGGSVTALAGYDEGAWWVQDAAASLPARLLDPHQGDQIADLCAAPGGKTAQLAASGAMVTAVDRSARRLTRVADNLARLRLAAQLVVADATEWQPQRLFDKILLDAPCSATGTLRRHPDVAWSKTPLDVEKLALTQDRLLDSAARLVRPGGILLFCTCSLLPAEGEERIAAFLQRQTSFRRQEILPPEVGGLRDLLTPEGDLRSLPCHLAEIGGMDGFYAARLRHCGEPAS